MTYVKIGGNTYPAGISGRISDYDWGGRASKTIRLQMTAAAAAETFVDDAPWSIVDEYEEEGQIVQHEYDNSEYCVAGDITDHRDGYVSVKMGKVTEGELLAIMTGGADR